jgi:uncharacterized RDD family membrane protein YckC
MYWYYMENGQQRGPLNEEEFEDSIRSGKVSADTPVWNERMSGWNPYGSIRKDGSPAEPPVIARQYTCVECRKSFPEDEVIRYGDSWICAACKPIFFQRLKEGARLPGTMAYGGFWIRGVAKIIDGLIQGVFGILLFLAFMPFLSFRGSQADSTGFLVWIGLQGGGVIFGLAYTVFFLGKYGATPGKMAVGLKVVTSEGGAIDYKRAVARYFAEILSGLICYAGYIMAAFDEERRALHDRLCDTRVVYK